MKSCTSCHINASWIVQTAIDKVLCRSCYTREKRRNAKLIDSLPEITEKEPPFKFCFFLDEVFSNPLDAQLHAEMLFLSKRGLAH